MASPTKKTEAVRANKKRPSKANLKADEKRLQKNLEIIEKATKAQ